MAESDEEEAEAEEAEEADAMVAAVLAMDMYSQTRPRLAQREQVGCV